MEKQEYTQSNIVTGMTCAGCSARVEKALAALPGVTRGAVNLATNTAFVVASRPISLEELETAVAKAGYGTSREPLEEVETRRYRDSKWRAALAVAAMIPPMVLMGLHMTGHHVPFMEWVNLVCGAVAIFVAGSGTLKGAWIAVSHRHSNMDVLVALGALSAWCTSLLRLLGVPVASFGMLSSMILALHLVGRFIESRLRDKAAREIRALLALRVAEGRVVGEDGTERMMPVELLVSGMVLRIAPGERIPADSTVLSGTGAVDESMLTGEPIPVAKAEGDGLTGGSVLVSGSLTASVTSVGEDSFLSRIISIIQEAQGAKIPLQALADRVTSLFVPIVISLALLAALVWYFFAPSLLPLLEKARGILPWVTHLQKPSALSIFAFLSTLLIACPCALGLATPMALIAATGAAGRHGILFRNGEALQTLGDVTAVVLDKTGTLTLGRPEVVYCDVKPEDLPLLAAMERSSSHPLAKALSALDDSLPALEGVEEEPGVGLSLTKDGRVYQIGRPEGDGAGLKEQLDAGRMVVEWRVDGVPAGLIALEDPLRPEAAKMISGLKARGVLTLMATGDNPSAASRVASRLGLDRVEAGLHPQDKLTVVRRLQGEGHRVLMMGDGINDAAALKGADVGVAVGEGSELAVESADLISLRDGGAGLAQVIDLSRFARKVIGQNLFWAFGYNFIALPLAMACLLHPMIAEAAMTFSSLSVVLNSLRIHKR